jgi:DNA-binding MarR family transcriptional regulator/catechol 2,3-dioxygenase-like lactoylglutathione lyase family enzyme
MMRTSSDQAALFLRAVLALGRRLRASRSPRTQTLPGLGVLGTLYRLGPLVATQLAAEEGLRPQSLTRMLAELERNRLIRRKRSSSDGRAITITLTARGRNKLLDEIAERRSWLNAAMAAALTPDERRTAQAAAIVMLKLATCESKDGNSMTGQAQPDAAVPVIDQDLSRTRYTNVKLEDATFTDVNLKGVAFRDVNLSAATYTNVRLEDATFTDVNLKGVVFRDVDLSAAVFEDVNLAHASIRDSQLDGMTINGIPVLELMGAARNKDSAQVRLDEPTVEPVESTTVFHVSDLEKSLAFYTGTLGFKVDFKYGKPESYAGLSWKSVHLHLSSSYPYKNNTGHGNLYIHGGDIDRLYERLDSLGVDFYSRILDREYGMRDFSIKDPDGNQIGFGASMAAT